MSKLRSALLAYKNSTAFGGYIQDGLVFQLDCDKECSTEKWTDLIGGVEFIGTNISLVDGVPYFDGTSNYQGNNPIQLDNYTIEISHEHNSYNNNIVFYIISNIVSKTSLSLKGNFKNINNIYRWCVDVPLYTFGDNNTHLSNTFTSNIENWLDSNKMESVGVDGGGYGVHPCIGCRSDLKNTNKFIGKIFSIRVYNRVLSNDEIVFNHSIDNNRFSSR